MAGVMLAVAGCIIQRLTGNPMASPEVLGISSGAAFGVVLMLFLVPGMLSVGYCLPEARRGGDTADYYVSRRARRFLAATDVAGGDGAQHRVYHAANDAPGERRPADGGSVDWIAGSTYNATDGQVTRTAIVMVILLALVPLCRRWLTILPLGGDAARAVGMALTPSRIALLALAACLTATATMTIGPLSFVGLMAPHIARMLGFRRTMPHMVISALAGGVLLVFADWCGRMALFPYQIPAGLLSSFIGAPYFIYLLRKQSR